MKPQWKIRVLSAILTTTVAACAVPMAFAAPPTETRNLSHIVAMSAPVVTPPSITPPTVQGPQRPSVATPRPSSSSSVQTSNGNAVPTASSIIVDGTLTAFDAYTINQNNYFKLRDLAFILRDTRVKFDVYWDQEAQTIQLLSNRTYTLVGGEMSGKGTKTQTAVPNTSAITLDGSKITLAAYTIHQNNYFKLRDIAEVFDFGVTWDGVQNAIRIDTNSSYTPE